MRLWPTFMMISHFLAFKTLENLDLDSYDSSIVNYVGGFVTRRIVKRTCCEKCLKFLKTQGSKTKWLKLKEYEGCNLFAINDELMHFFKYIELSLRGYLNFQHVTKSNFVERFVIKTISMYLSENFNVFPELRDHSTLEDLRYEVMKMLELVKTFLEHYVWDTL